jgi:ABC-2 type transport system permease protein
MIGNALPLTYFNRLVRGILLKGAGWGDLWPHLWPMLIFMFVVMALAVRFYRRTLD